MRSEISLIDIRIAVAINECGRVELYQVNENCVQNILKFDEWKKKLKSDGQFWSMKIIDVKIPAATQYEKIEAVQ